MIAQAGLDRAADLLDADGYRAIGGIVIFLLVNGIAAERVWFSKGGHRGRGFLWGFFSGPVGFFLVAFAKPGKRRCESCTNSIPDRANVCPTCGRAVEVAPT